MKKLIEGVDYYLDNSLFVFTRVFHEKRGFCCGNGCKHCAYEPPHIKNNTKLKPTEVKKISD